MASNRRILVVDDNREIHEDFREILASVEDYGSSAFDALTADILGEEAVQASDESFELDFASQGQEALTMVEKAIASGQPYAVAFVDVRMPPGWDGVETISHLWEMDPRLQAVIITAYADYDWSQIIEKLGSSDRLLILKKPFENIEIRQLASALSEKWQLSSQVEESMAELQAREEKLTVVRDYLKTLIDAMPSALVGIDTEGRITHLNTIATHLLQQQSDEAIGKKLAEIYPPLGEEIERAADTVLREGVYRRDKLSCQLGGDTFIADVVVYPLGNALTGGMVIRIDNVTEQVRIEEMLTQSEKMMSVGGLAAGMAHEINNPLGGILQGLQNIRRRFTPGLKANDELAEHLGLDLSNVQHYMEQRQILHFMDEMADAGQRASDIVNNMLQFSRKSDAVRTAEDINTVIERTLDLAKIDYDLKKKYDFRMIVIERELEFDLPKVPCIASEIQQVLLNILRNAAQALQECKPDVGSHIIVRSRRHNDKVTIEIEDNGPGIEADVAARVFEPFFTTRPVGEGTGLGLSVSYFIIHEEHGGELSVESQPGKGSRFIIELPI